MDGGKIMVGKMFMGNSDFANNTRSQMIICIEPVQIQLPFFGSTTLKMSQESQGLVLGTPGANSVQALTLIGMYMGGGIGANFQLQIPTDTISYGLSLSILIHLGITPALFTINYEEAFYYVTRTLLGVTRNYDLLRIQTTTTRTGSPESCRLKLIATDRCITC